MATPYSEIDNMFLHDIKDYDFLDFTDEDRDEVLQDLRIKAVTRFKACKVDLTDRDDTLLKYNSTLTDEEKLIIATSMRKFWLNNKSYDLELLKHRLSSKDWRMTSQAEHLSKIILLKKDLDAEISNMIISYTVYAYSPSGI